ncbi:WD40 repeat domain-containing protein [Cystobacter ferrugineus]|uniref:Anaphase-promoting complex subunit 4 WD40 domain-containing protein n=1 Tax=Cystobacter ferrugineus TaxID=83449 RepID=A0A1L9BI03_9BACT|nr:hypothetical protein [Cystobacter ferrugineus]OJH41883.1 hypothetical protein BON30_01200 [Cystobacter ferrugineus]
MPGVSVASRRGRAAPMLAELYARVELPDHVNALRWSPEGALLAAASLAGPVFLLDGGSGAVRRELRGHEGGALCVDFSPDGTRLASGGQDGAVRLYGVADGAVKAEQSSGGAWVEHLEWAPSGKSLASAAGRGVRVWSSRLTHLGGFESHPGTVSALYWLEEKDEVVAACNGGLFRSAAGQTKPTGYMPYKGAIQAVAPSPDGRFIAIGCQDGTAFVWWMGSTRTFTMPGHQGKVRVLAWSPESTILATGDAEAINLWRLSGPGSRKEQPLRLETPGGRVTGLVWRNDGLLMSTSEDGTLRGWLPHEGGEPLFTVRAEEPLSELVLSPDGIHVAAAGLHGRAFLFRLPVLVDARPRVAQRRELSAK